MRIIAYDSAIENLGICVVEFDPLWRDNIITLMKSDTDIWKKIEELDKLLSKVINILWLNVIDLVPDDGKTDHIQKTELLKTVMYAIDKMVGPFDIVLIEKQMTPNDKTRSMSAQISSHYCGYGGIKIIEKVGKKKKIKAKSRAISKCSHITYASKKFAIESIDKMAGPKVIMIGPSLKNQYDLDKTAPYSLFAMKYASNYTANKAHAEHQFRHFLNTMGRTDIIEELHNIQKIAKNKVADIADSFMMIYAYIIGM
jgi:hypothetical protein